MIVVWTRAVERRCTRRDAGPDRQLSIDAVMDSVRSLQAQTLGDPAVCVAVLDGPVDVGHPCFRGADLGEWGPCAGRGRGGDMSAHGTHVASVIFGGPESPVPGWLHVAGAFSYRSS